MIASLLPSVPGIPLMADTNSPHKRPSAKPAMITRKSPAPAGTEGGKGRKGLRRVGWRYIYKPLFLQNMLVLLLRLQVRFRAIRTGHIRVTHHNRLAS